MQRSPSCPSRRWLTRVEVLAVLFMIGVLFCFLAPGLQSQRINSRRSQCLNNLKNVTAATMNYAATHDGRLPHLRSPLHDGLTAPRVGWPVALLPYFDNPALHEELVAASKAGDTDHFVALQAVRVAGFTCPEDTRFGDEVNGVSYVANAGLIPSAPLRETMLDSHDASLWWWGHGSHTDRAITRAAGVFRDDEPTTMSDINTHDGATQTLLFAERSAAAEAARWSDASLESLAFGWTLDGRRPYDRIHPTRLPEAGGIGHAAALMDALAIDAATLEGRATLADLPSFGLASPHPDITNVFYADGHGGVLVMQTDAEVYLQMLSPNGTTYGQQHVDPDAF